ncbi:MAG: N-acetylmuramoyl-L-alanine amidase [Actinomycetota bacterium]|nr:N-acetylmuramoyl-L-alanine amidase [Actinomycetota bacterium]
MTEPRTRLSVRIGYRGSVVRDLRERLVALGLHGPVEQWNQCLHQSPHPGPGDALTQERFDEALDQAVRSFQQQRGLLVDGIVGPWTFDALESARWRLGDRLLQFTPGHLLRGDDVTELQERLVGLGFNPGRIDGRFGSDTDAAVRAFQRGVGLTPDGSVGPSTLQAFADLRRSVAGGSPLSLRERELVRRSGHSLAGRIVVLDPGHGGGDLGAVAHGVVESDVVHDIARRIEGRLSAHGASVVYTRGQLTSAGDDEARAHIANDCGADIMLSLHCDTADQQGASGVATFFYGQKRFGAWSAVGEQLADLIQRETVARTGLTDCRSHARSWTLLQHTRMPAVRIETGYVSNAADAARLREPGFRDDIAEGIVVALQRLYLGEQDTASTGVLRLGDLRKVLEELVG